MYICIYVYALWRYTDTYTLRLSTGRLIGSVQNDRWVSPHWQVQFSRSLPRESVCVYYCSTYYKAVRVGGKGIVEDMCYERRRAEAYVD